MTIYTDSYFFIILLLPNYHVNPKTCFIIIYINDLWHTLHTGLEDFD